MPKRVETWRPPWVRKKPSEQARPNAAARGYCTPEWRRTRLAVIARDMGICQLCGTLVTNEPGDVDHVVPKSKGGTDALSNLRYCHHSCHAKRTARDGC
jgi:5-methylcytosine-specific restriction protein A